MFKQDRIFALFIGLAVLVIAVSNFGSSKEDEVQIITVSASGEVYSLPEQAYITITVSHDVDAEDIAEFFAKTMGTLEDIDIKQVDGFFSTYSNGYKNYEGEQYDIRNTYQINIYDMSIIDDLIDAVATQLEIDNYNLYFVPFASDDLEQQTIDIALANAQTKAQYLADQTGNTIGDILELSISNSYDSIASGNYQYNYSDLMASSELQDLAVRPAPNKVSTTITVTFELK